MDYVFCKSEYSFSVISTALKQRGYSTGNLVTTGWRSPNIEVSLIQRILIKSYFTANSVTVMFTVD